MSVQEIPDIQLKSNKDGDYFSTRVLRIIHHTQDIFELHLERKNLKFSPGDFVSIYSPSLDVYREYSIASGIHDNHLSFLIKHLQKGILTDFLASRKKGGVITLGKPQGLFRPGLSHQLGKFVFIATGTGIAPFLSYIKSYPEKPPSHFLYGVRYRKDALNFEAFQSLCPSYLTISREDIPPFHKGRVTDLLPLLPLHQNVHFYLCGLDSMITDVTHWLKSHNISPGQIHHEIFFYSKT